MFFALTTREAAAVPSPFRTVSFTSPSKGRATVAGTISETTGASAQRSRPLPATVVRVSFHLKFVFSERADAASRMRRLSAMGFSSKAIMLMQEKAGKSLGHGRLAISKRTSPTVNERPATWPATSRAEGRFSVVHAPSGSPGKIRNEPSSLQATPLSFFMALPSPSTREGLSMSSTIRLTIRCETAAMPSPPSCDRRATGPLWWVVSEAIWLRGMPTTVCLAAVGIRRLR